MVWQQELYTTFEYKTPRSQFHTFEADDCQAGLNFANDQEAQAFQAVIADKLRMRQQKQEERKRGLTSPNTGSRVARNGTSGHPVKAQGAPSHQRSQSNLSSSNNKHYSDKKSKKDKENKKSKEKSDKLVKAKLSKNDIGKTIVIIFF